MKRYKFIRSTSHFPVKDLQQTLAYYRDVLGFYDEWTFGNKDGGIRRDDLRLLFGEDPEHVSMLNNENTRFNMLWFVENIEEILSEFKRKVSR
ncbi:MAG: VOC family protein [Chitinophagaceae bacterium]|nr:VOC family protein [Chitinophagaceae bacterium]